MASVDAWLDASLFDRLVSMHVIDKLDRERGTDAFMTNCETMAKLSVWKEAPQSCALDISWSFQGKPHHPVLTLTIHICTIKLSTSRML